jgi:DNA helicase HerA-like ATPase
LLIATILDERQAENMLPTSQPDLEREIAEYERHALNRLRPSPIDLVALLNQNEFVRVKGLANFWQAHEKVDLVQHVIDFVIGAHGYSDYLTFVLTGDAQQVNLYVSVKNVGTTKSLLQSAYPGVLLQKDSVRSLGSMLKTRIAHVGMMSGIPSTYESDQPQSGGEPDFYHLERIIRGMKDAAWVYIVKAYPRSSSDVVTERQQLLDRIAQVASFSRAQIQQSTQASNARTTRQTETVSKMMGAEIVNRRAEYTVELMERELERLDACLSVGRWQTAIYFGTTNEADTRRLAYLLAGLLAGPNSRPDPIRVHFCKSENSTPVEQFHTYLSSDEVALLIPPPREEAPGYAVLDTAPFDVDFESDKGSGLKIGKIQWDDLDSGQSYRIKIDDLTRHGVVFGVTGSGKTTSLLGLLNQAWQADPAIPFLVIEPAKTEYRALRGRVQNGISAGPIPDLRVYTLGNNSIAPFRLNPFEFETGDDPISALLLAHIDFLKAVFNAAFILYAPMPYVLETALHQIYEDKGWNLATETNVRLPSEEWKNRHCYPLFPTLTDLYNKVEEVTARLGYEARIEQDVIAGLKARLGALRLGAKGMMLDTPRGIPLSVLLAKPTVLELENIGSDEEKTFLMGLLLARVYEHRRLQAAEGKLKEDLQHILVVEEAHRLLKNVSTHVDTESSNLRAQAIETFVNMLSEVRHYGQGVLVAEQIPSKLTPDVIKNTNLKVVHRMLAKDDRELVGSSMNMNEAQTKRLATLDRGEAAVYAEGDDHPLLVKVENFKTQRHLEMPLDSELRDVSETYVSLSQYLPIPDFANYGLRIAKFGGPDPVVYQVALHHLDQENSRRIWGRIIARTIFARNTLLGSIEHLHQQLVSSPGHLVISQYNEALIMLIVLGVAQALQERGAEMGWSYPVVEGTRLLLTEGLVKLARTRDLKTSAPDLDKFVRTYESKLKRELGPYPGCRKCRAICSYRAEVKRMLSPVERGHIHAILSDVSYKTQGEKYADLGSTLKGTVKQWLGGEGTEIEDIGYCAALVAAPSIGLNEYEQAEMAHKLAMILLP